MVQQIYYCGYGPTHILLWIWSNTYIIEERIQVWKVIDTSQGMYGSGLIAALGAYWAIYCTWSLLTLYQKTVCVVSSASSPGMKLT
jgi:hypothetical protein